MSILSSEINSLDAIDELVSWKNKTKQKQTKMYNSWKKHLHRLFNLENVANMSVS